MIFFGGLLARGLAVSHVLPLCYLIVIKASRTPEQQYYCNVESKEFTLICPFHQNTLDNVNTLPYSLQPLFIEYDSTAN